MPVVLNGKYTLGRTLGSGASCKVKLAKDDSGRRYAVKILNNNEDFEEMIQTELDALTQLAEHPNIV